MTVLGFASAKGAPGTTTLVLGLARVWAQVRPGRRALLVEADPDGGSIAADYFAGQAPTDRGVAGLALARDIDPVEAVRAQCVEVADAGFTVLLGPDTPARARGAAAGWPVLAAGVRAMRAVDECDVLVDLGRGRVDDLTARCLLPLLDELVWVTGSSLSEVLATRAAVTATAGETRDVGVVVVGPDRPYPTEEIADAVGVPVRATIPYDRHLSGNTSGRSRFSPWHRAIRALAAALTTDDQLVPARARVVVGDG